jgi:hypothetical protein
VVIEAYVKYPGGPTRIRVTDVQCAMRSPLLFWWGNFFPSISFSTSNAVTRAPISAWLRPGLVIYRWALYHAVSGTIHNTVPVPVSENNPAPTCATKTLRGIKLSILTLMSQYYKRNEPRRIATYSGVYVCGGMGVGGVMKIQNTQWTSPRRHISIMQINEW